MNIFKRFRKFPEKESDSGISNLNSFPSRETFQETIRKWSALRVPGGNQVDGLPPARHTEPQCFWKGPPPRRSVMLDVNIVIQMILCIGVTSSVTSKVFKLYWSFIFPEYQLLCSTKLKFWTRASLFGKSQKWWIFFKISENSRKYRWARNLEFESVPKKEIQAK